jgi:hypothetical protein
VVDFYADGLWRLMNLDTVLSSIAIQIMFQSGNFWSSVMTYIKCQYFQTTWGNFRKLIRQLNKLTLRLISASYFNSKNRIILSPFNYMQPQLGNCRKLKDAADQATLRDMSLRKVSRLNFQTTYIVYKGLCFTRVARNS